MSYQFILICHAHICTTLLYKVQTGLGYITNNPIAGDSESVNDVYHTAICNQVYNTVPANCLMVCNNNNNNNNNNNIISDCY